MSGYYDRAMRASDPRYKNILDKMGYGKRDLVAVKRDIAEIDSLRAEYRRIFGKKPFHGWDAETIEEKIAERADEE